MSAPVFLSLDEETAPRTPSLAGIVLAVSFLGMLIYFGTFLAGDDPLVFYQIGVLVGLLAYLLTFADIILGIGILVAGIGLSPEFTLGGIPNLRMEDFIVPAITAAWATRSIRSREGSGSSRMKGPLGAFLASMSLALVAGGAGGTTKWIYGLLCLGKFIEYVLIFVLVAHNVRTEGAIRSLCIFSILVAILSAFLGISPGPPGMPGRAQGPLGETATIFGAYLLLNFFLTLGGYLHAANLWLRLAAAAACVILGTAVVLTYSRTTYAALTLGLALFGVFKQRRVLVLTLVLLTAFPLLAPEGIWHRAATISTVVAEAATPSWAARVSAWKTALSEWLTRAPLTGFGPGATPMGNIDNEYIQRLYETGLLGTAAFLWCLGRLIRISNTLFNSLPTPGFPKGLAAGYLMGFAGMLVHAIGATSFSAIRPMEQFMFLSGLMVALTNLVEPRSPGDAPADPDEPDVPVRRER